MSDLRTSLLINRQLPEYVRDDYPLFLSFLEAYYEFLENQQGTEKNDLTTKAKNLRYVSDVDTSIDDFEDNFFNTYATLVPKDVAVDKAFLIKHLLPLYLSKGSEKSFKFLFRMLFNDEVSILQPKNNVLRSSDGKWTVENILKLETDIRSVYTANGNTSSSAVETGNTTFVLGQVVDANEVDVYVNDVIQTEGTDYYLRKETRKVIFVTPPAANSIVKAVYTDFDITKLNNRKLTGLTSGATALVETASKKIVTDRLNFGLPFEIFINPKTLVGSFFNGETVTTDIIDTDGSLINFEADTFSILTKINVVDGGASYNVGDPVAIVGGGATTIATAEVDSIYDGFTSRIVVNYGGAGFKTASLISSSNTPGSTLITGAVDAVNTTHFTANTYNVLGVDIIGDYSNVFINAADYGFPHSGTENSSTRIIDALSNLIVTDLGPITNAVILFSNVSVNTATLDSEGAKYAAGNTFFDIKDFGSIGRIDVTTAGSGYKVGDEINFGAAPGGTSGYGAAATVKTVTAGGGILTTMIQPPRITGTANVLNNTVQIIGTGTNFTSELQVGDKIIIKNQERYVNAITSSTTANVNASFSWTDSTIWANNYNIGSFALGLVGGQNYTQNNFPTVTASTQSGGAGASLTITSRMGDGEIMDAFTDVVAGEIRSIKLTTGGVGYEYIPEVDLTAYGDGTAIANATLGPSYTTMPGRWTTSDSILSSTERKLQGSNYYVDYSYVTSSFTEFAKYKKILRELLHPSGFVNYADLNKEVNSTEYSETVDLSKSNTISGYVAIQNSSIYITGTGTLFNVANTRNIITIGSSIAVNGEIRVVNNFISNTNISVSSAFTSNANSQTLLILT